MTSQVDTAAPVVSVPHQRRQRERRVGPSGVAAIIPAGQEARSVPTTWPASRLSPARIHARARAAFDTSMQLRRSGLTRLLEWLGEQPGNSWQQRWMAGGADGMLREWWRAVPASGHGSATETALRAAVQALLGIDAIRPSMAWVVDQYIQGSMAAIMTAHDPTALERLHQACAEHEVTGPNQTKACAAVTRIMMAKGGTLDQITVGDCVEYWHARRTAPRKVIEGVLFYTLLYWMGTFGTQAPPNLSAATRRGRLSSAQLIDRYEIACRPIRDLLVDYLDARRPGMDYTSVSALATNLGLVFWRDLELHHPGIDSLHLPAQVVEAWTGRLSVITYNPYQAGKTRTVPELTLGAVRAFYLDLAAWAIEEPARWGPFVAPCPIKANQVSYKRQRQRRKSAMDQRTRALSPALPALLAEIDTQHRQATNMLEAARAAPVGGQFTAAGAAWRRQDPKDPVRGGRIYAIDPDGRRVDLVAQEDRTFWTWATVETLRHTGVRIEELLELTHHSFAAYSLPSTGEIVPLLQIAPSKTDTERVLLVSPELGEVLAAVIERVRAGRAAIPLVSRWDEMEREWSALMPFLLQRPVGGINIPIKAGYIRRQLDRVALDAGLSDPSAQPLRFTPHDFRRIFATDALRAGLPPHIAAKILGHTDINVTLGYAAIYPDEVITQHRAFIARRRALRPGEEYRELTAAEWDEFLEHFELRKVELGVCTRAFGTPCVHEHACVRCPALRPDPGQLPRLEEILANLRARLTEAHAQGWRGEIAGLEVSIDAAARKLDTMRALRARHQTTYLGMPDFRSAVARTNASTSP